LNLGKIENLAIHRALSKHGGNISQAAKELGLSRAALYRRLQKHDI
jgi:two-component system response regulator HydG